VISSRDGHLRGVDAQLLDALGDGRFAHIRVSGGFGLAVASLDELLQRGRVEFGWAVSLRTFRT
jgi:hypothetical protein